MLEDTADLGSPVDTDVGTETAPPVDALPEIADADLLPETVEGDKEPETEQPEDLASKTDEELEQDARVKALLEKKLKDQEARLNESARRKAENAANAARKDQLEKEHTAAVANLRGDVGKQLLSGVSRSVAANLQASIKKWADDNGVDAFQVDPRAVHQQLTGNLVALVDGVVANGVEEGVKVFDLFRRKEYADYKPDEEDVSALANARLQKDFKAAGAITASMLLKAQLASEEPKIRADERKKVLEELRKDAEARKANGAAQARQEKPKPTTAQANGAAVGRPRVTIDEINRLGVTGLRNRYPDKAEREAVIKEARDFADKQLAGSR